MKTKNIQNKPNYTGIKHLLKRKKTKPKDGFEKNGKIVVDTIFFRSTANAFLLYSH